MKSKYILSLLFFFIFDNSKAQVSGYLGKKNAIECSFNIMPSFVSNSSVYEKSNGLRLTRNSFLESLNFNPSCRI